MRLQPGPAWRLGKAQSLGTGPSPKHHPWLGVLNAETRPHVAPTLSHDTAGILPLSSNLQRSPGSVRAEHVDSIKGQLLGSSQRKGQARRRRLDTQPPPPLCLQQRQSLWLLPVVAKGRGTPLSHSRVHRTVRESVISTPPPRHALPHCHADKTPEQRVARPFSRPCGP